MNVSPPVDPVSVAWNICSTNSANLLTLESLVYGIRDRTDSSNGSSVLTKFASRILVQCPFALTGQSFRLLASSSIVPLNLSESRTNSSKRAGYRSLRAATSSGGA